MIAHMIHEDTWAYPESKRIEEFKVDTDNEGEYFRKFRRYVNSMRYAQMHIYFDDKSVEKRYMEWEQTDEAKRTSFADYYLGGTVD